MRTAALTHAIPPYAERNGRFRRALCYQWVGASDHSHTPTCEQCARLLADEDDGKTAEELFGDGSDSDPVVHRDYDPITGSEWRKP
jgi:hypothetical protein